MQKKVVAVHVLCRSAASGLSSFLRKKPDGTYGSTFCAEDKNPSAAARDPVTSDRAILRNSLGLIFEPKLVARLLDDPKRMRQVKAVREEGQVTHFYAVVIEEGEIPNEFSHQLESPIFPLVRMHRDADIRPFAKGDVPDTESAAYVSSASFDALQEGFAAFAPKRLPVSA